MRKGAWHQCGSNSQKLALEQLEAGQGVGVILSPRDLAERLALQYAAAYQGAGADVLFDQQFYIPSATLGKLGSYEMSEYRRSVATLNQISDQELSGMARELERLNRLTGAAAVIAPAVVYEAGRTDIVDLNCRLFRVAKMVGDKLGIPTYATVVLSESLAGSDSLIAGVLAEVTGLDSDGWYFAFEFSGERIPAVEIEVVRCCRAGLTLACTGKPVLHAYAGPMGLLSPGFAATAVGVGHNQKLWQFTRGRWEAGGEQGGGGDAPARFFSRALWGTIVYPDEVALLPRDLARQAVVTSPFAEGVSPSPPFLYWSRWNAGKHLVYTICQTVADLATAPDPRAAAQAAISILDEAIALHARIAAPQMRLRDNTAAYQIPWRNALIKLLSENGSDFDYLELLG
jgi:hypothetical protein